ncbi:hypothetical protein K437DRAFT_237021 [Tilletiaria anomala UBC 951]|uniref:IMD domain-containing protein n=1 Tax=Tilletiaria anomala (strain ATCC 24038 / CBS 436.72 / UBC 951) TaxID=1037660 RepID=A0A066VYB0_TILAU|nr:uncharacterized protein K437DRAFT_237021 [Tilletiaria anomala UBC 951]KDN43794.1 hypothetical protein K437DRAFT_237021 [Tilletiaria anomala UBC 951]
MPATRSVRSFAASHQGHGHVHGGNGPPSPTLTATTRASLDFPYRPAVLVTRADLRASVQAYERVLGACKAYTNSMLVLSHASADLASALQECSKVKGAHEQADKLQACGGLHFLISNYSQVLADSFWKDFQIPLLESFDAYRQACNERQLLHEKQILEKSRMLKETEARNMKLGSKGGRGKGAEGGRDLNSFRRALAELQRQVDELDELKADYYNEVLESEQEMWEFIQSKVTHLVRSQLEIYDRISSKGLSDPVLEPLLASIPDPFDSYGPPKSEDQIFSILPPTSLLGASASGSGGAGGSHTGSGAVTPARLVGAGGPPEEELGISKDGSAARDDVADPAGAEPSTLANGVNGTALHSSPTSTVAAAGPDTNAGTSGESVKRSNSLFGTLRYEDGRRKGDGSGENDDEEDDGFLASSTSSTSRKSSSNGNSGTCASNGTTNEPAPAAQRERNKHPLSIIQEDAPASAVVSAILPSAPAALAPDKECHSKTASAGSAAAAASAVDKEKHTKVQETTEEGDDEGKEEGKEEGNEEGNEEPVVAATASADTSTSEQQGDADLE